MQIKGGKKYEKNKEKMQDFRTILHHSFREMFIEEMHDLEMITKPCQQRSI